MRTYSRLSALVFIVAFALVASVGRSMKIPRQLILTGELDDMLDISADVRANVRNTLLLSFPNFLPKAVKDLLTADGLEPVKPRWFGDKTCRDYIATHYDEELVGFFDRARPGRFSSDICRAAVLYREGGFYTDVNVELNEPLTELVDADTTFMSVFSERGDMLNGLIAVEPHSEIIGETLQEIRKWFRGESKSMEPFMQRGLENVVRKSCLEEHGTHDPKRIMTLMKRTTQWSCGQHQIRLFRQDALECYYPEGSAPPSECPLERQDADGVMRMGFFYPDLLESRRLIAWPHFHSCDDPKRGCGSRGGGDRQLRLPQVGDFSLPHLMGSMKIPRQLVLTGKPNEILDMSAAIRTNVQNDLQLSFPNFLPKAAIELLELDGVEALQPRWLGDGACRDYITTHYDQELVGFFDRAHPGNYRGDICRAAVLYREGGFYADVDVELKVPLTELVDADTTFMSVYSEHGDIFNGLLAVEPQSEIIGETLQEIRKWYRGESKQEGLMGTMTMLRGLENVVRKSCLQEHGTRNPKRVLDSKKRESQWPCGRHQIRMYQEDKLKCNYPEGAPPPSECPLERKHADGLMQIGFFHPNLQESRRLIGWPRFHRCEDPQGGCGSGGHTERDGQIDRHQGEARPLLQKNRRLRGVQKLGPEAW